MKNCYTFKIVVPKNEYNTDIVYSFFRGVKIGLKHSFLIHLFHNWISEGAEEDLEIKTPTEDDFADAKKFCIELGLFFKSHQLTIHNNGKPLEE